MLVLSRTKNETIIIDNNIEVTIVSIRGGTVQIGIKAPKHISIDRKEIRDRKDKE